jgi:type IX secretion system PorP/SprF family membrane protein
MKQKIRLTFFILISGLHVPGCFSQENLFSHYFATSTVYNPAFAGDTRFIQIALINRIQPTVSQIAITNTSLSYDQKIPNHHSGININLNQKDAVFKELQIKLSYSYTVVLSRKSAVKGGVGISWNSINTHATTYKFPDQYDINGFTGQPTSEPSLDEKAVYPSLTTGIVMYTTNLWLSFGMDNLNRPAHQFAGEKIHVPVALAVNGGFLFPLNKNKQTKRIFSQNGGFEPYSSIGPVCRFHKQGPFNEASFGLNAFTKPIFWGINYQLNTFKDPGPENRTNLLNLLAGLRIEALSISYSYGFFMNHTPTNYKGVHEVSLVYYFYTIKEDYKKHLLIPFPNQLMF